MQHIDCQDGIKHSTNQPTICDISRRSNVLAKLSAIRGTITKEDKDLIGLDESKEDIQEHKIANPLKNRHPVSNIEDTSNKLVIGLEASLQADLKMDGAERDSYSFRGRPDEHELAARDIRDSFNDRRQRERSPDERGPFRPMDTFQSRRVRNEQGRSDEKEKGRIGSDISSGRNRRGDSAARRSRSRERNNTQRTRRSRSKSPPSEFIKVLERWKKFKQSQRVMLDGVQRKKEIYDKRPEDHPDYPEEWRLFWEKRYKELQAQGKEADNHDYKTEWIPYWGKRVKEIYEAEIKVKTESMLHKYELQSANEPKKEDFTTPKPKSSNADAEKEDISAFMGDYQRYRSARGNDDLMIVGERSNSERSQSRLYGDSRDRDREKDYRYERDREHRTERDREREKDRSRNIGSHSGNHNRSARERRSRSRERSGKNVDSARENERNRGRSPYSNSNYENDTNKRHNSNRLSPNNQDAMSGLTALENIRDRGVSRSPARDTAGNDKFSGVRGPLNFIPHEMQDTSPRLMETLRILTALEDLLGSLGPQVNIIMSRAITLENNKEGAGNILLEDADVAVILQMTKEKLSGQIIAGLLEPQKEFAVRNCIDKLTMVLQIATKKRPSNPPSLSNGPSQDDISKMNKHKYKKILAEQMAKLLIKQGMQNVDEWYLHYLVYEVAKTTPLDDGTLCTPPYLTIPPAQLLKDDLKKGKNYDRSSEQGGYSTGLSSGKSGSIFDEKSECSQKSPSKQSRSSNSTNRTNDEFDDLTIIELKSLLDNFKNLSKSEQMDLIHYMKKLETTNPEKVLQLRSSFSTAMSSGADPKDDQILGSDGLGSAMLQVLARNVHSFTNDNSQSKHETQNRFREFDNRTTEANSNSSNNFQSNSASNPTSGATIDISTNSDPGLQLSSNQDQLNTGNFEKIKGNGSSQNSGNNTSLSSALVAPPPPPPPPEDSLQGPGPSQLAQGPDGNFSHATPPFYNHPMAEMNPPQSWDPGYVPERNNQYTNNMQHNPGTSGYRNFGNTPSGWMGAGSTSFPPGGVNYSGAYNGAVGVNPAAMGGPNIPRPYGNNQMFPNQNQGPPRYW